MIVKVTNMEEDGEVKVTLEQPRVGVEMTAGLTDGRSDGVAYGPMWQVGAHRELAKVLNG